jgi:hypothetical protein
MYDTTWNVLVLPDFPHLDLGFKTYSLVNKAPTTPVINGPTSGVINTEYTFDVYATDPNNDMLTYIIEWSQNEQETTNPSPSGVPVTVNHTWSEQGEYTIKVKAIDSYGAESDWGECMLSIPKQKETKINFFQMNLAKVHQNTRELFKLIFKYIFVGEIL